MSFEDLNVWKRAVKLSSETYKQTFGLKDYGFRDQLTRSGLSIPSNIAEGYERKSDREIAQFLTIAKGSAGEFRTQVYIGTITIVPLAVILIGDAGRVIELIVKDRMLLTGMVWLRAGALGMSLVALGFMVTVTAQKAWKYYCHFDAVHLQGSRFTRMPEEQAITYRFLADTIHASVDTFVCKIGLNSLYFWSQTRPASTVTISHSWQAFDELEVGGVIINDVPTYRIDHMPYGGVKDSGLGREGLRWAIEDMTELRLMVIAQPG